MVSSLVQYDKNTLDPIGRFMSKRSRMAPPTAKEYKELFERMDEGSESARNELIERHVRLVASIALKFRMSKVPMEDIMAEGIEGLVIALDKFDHTRGVKLSTYASWWIRQRIQRLVGKMSSAVSVPHDVSQGKRKMQKIRDHMQAELGRPPKEEELAEALGQEYKVANRVKFAPKGHVSMDQPLMEDSRQTISDVMSEDSDTLDSYREHGSLADDMKVALSFLDERESKVLRMRFGMENGECMKLYDIADELQVSGERVRQLESLGLRKLRAVLIDGGEIDFGNVDKLIGTDLDGKTKMSPLELSLILDSAN